MNGPLHVAARVVAKAQENARTVMLALDSALEAAPGQDGADPYPSDPARPVPYYNGIAIGMARDYMTADQRFAGRRPDVLSYRTEPLKADLTLAGPIQADLWVSTTGTDSDWVVKLIDVYPDEVAGQPQIGGYQLMVSADIFRGRYREGFETAKAIEPNKPLPYRFALPTANHVFLKGHRLMVQVQSAWFPLYDRNPQTFVPNIFWAKPEDFKKATQRIYHSSYIELPMAKP